MAVINWRLEKPKRDGACRVFIQLSSGGVRKRIFTGIDILPNELRKTRGGAIKITNATKEHMIETLVQRYKEKLFDLGVSNIGCSLNADDILKGLTTKRKNELEFFEFADDWLSYTTIKAKRNYVTMLRSLENYLGKRYLLFVDITYSMLDSYARSLYDRPRACSLYLSLLRHLHNEARRKYNTDEQTLINNPFERYRVPKEKKKLGVRTLTQEDIIKIAKFKGKAHSRAQLARDCFLLSFCLMGMNSVDLYSAPPVRGGKLCYNRVKTTDRRSDGAYIEVVVHPVLSRLMKLYKGESRAFNFYKRYVSPMNFNSNLNEGLKEVGKEVGISQLQFYQARHTFATLSRNLMRFSKSDVDEALNHVGAYDIADIYIKKDFSIINDNNKQLLDKVFEGVSVL